MYLIEIISGDGEQGDCLSPRAIPPMFLFPEADSIAIAEKKKKIIDWLQKHAMSQRCPSRNKSGVANYCEDIFKK